MLRALSWQPEASPTQPCYPGNSPSKQPSWIISPSLLQQGVHLGTCVLRMASLISILPCCPNNFIYSLSPIYIKAAENKVNKAKPTKRIFPSGTNCVTVAWVVSQKAPLQVFKASASAQLGIKFHILYHSNYLQNNTI